MRISRGKKSFLGELFGYHVLHFVWSLIRLLIIITIDMLLWDPGIVFLHELIEFLLTSNDPQQELCILNSVLSEHEWSLQIALDPVAT